MVTDNPRLSTDRTVSANKSWLLIRYGVQLCLVSYHCLKCNSFRLEFVPNPSLPVTVKAVYLLRSISKPLRMRIGRGVLVSSHHPSTRRVRLRIIVFVEEKKRKKIIF